MEKPFQTLLIFLAFCLLKAASQDYSYGGWWNIDCGSEQPHLSNYSMPWLTDINFTKSGFNVQLPQKQPLQEMNTLRFFPDRREENCYDVPTSYVFAYIVRAGFYYGNYDGVSRAPTFDLEIDGQYWSTVNTSSMDGLPVYSETIYVGHGDIKVCLVQTKEGEVPFISSLEVMLIEADLYSDMVPYIISPQTDPKAAFHLVTRTNFGGPEVRFALDDQYYGDLFNRIWRSGITPKGCKNVSIPRDDVEVLDNYPPMGVLMDSIASINASDPIIFVIDLPFLNDPHPAFFIFYFSNSINDSNGLRTTNIYINDELKSTETFMPGNSSRVVTIYPVDVIGPTVNITLAPDPESNLTTTISAMEVFTKHHMEVPSPPPYKYVEPPPSAATPQLLASVYLALAYAFYLFVV